MPRSYLIVTIVFLAFGRLTLAGADDEIFRGSASFPVPAAIRVERNAPYSGEFIHEICQTHDGVTEVTSSDSKKFWRDSQGRVRSEHSFKSDPLERPHSC